MTRRRLWSRDLTLRGLRPDKLPAGAFPPTDQSGLRKERRKSVPQEGEGACGGRRAGCSRRQGPRLGRSYHLEVTAQPPHWLRRDASVYTLDEGTAGKGYNGPFCKAAGRAIRQRGARSILEPADCADSVMDLAKKWGRAFQWTTIVEMSSMVLANRSEHPRLSAKSAVIHHSAATQHGHASPQVCSRWLALRAELRKDCNSPFRWAIRGPKRSTNPLSM